MADFLWVTLPGLDLRVGFWRFEGLDGVDANLGSAGVAHMAARLRGGLKFDDRHPVVQQRGLRGHFGIEKAPSKAV